jgi:hypothetical protein
MIERPVTKWPAKVALAIPIAHLDHDPASNRPRNLKALSQRCHMLHDRDERLTLDSGRIAADPYRDALAPPNARNKERP